MKLSRWLPPTLGVAVFLLTLLCGGLLVADWAARNLEMRALVAAVEDSEEAMKWSDDQIQQVIEDFGANGKLTAAQKEEAWSALSEAAVAGEFAITASGEGVADVTVLPWHADIKRAQDAYVAHNEAWQKYMRTATDDPTVLFETQPDINSTFAAAQPLMEQAVPVPWLFNLQDRVDVIFADEQEATGPTQEVVLTAG